MSDSMSDIEVIATDTIGVLITLAADKQHGTIEEYFSTMMLDASGMLVMIQGLLHEQRDRLLTEADESYDSNPLRSGQLKQCVYIDQVLRMISAVALSTLIPESEF